VLLQRLERYRGGVGPVVREIRVCRAAQG
jgi:hypothetical protein